MTMLEEVLREAFASDVESPSHELVSDVRRGAKRRRARRTVAAVGTTAAAVVAGIVVVGSLSGGQTTPEPAPAPWLTTPGPSSSIEVSGSELLVTSQNDDCDCTVVWRYDGSWHRLSELPGTDYERLAMAPDGTNGLATQPGGAVFSTHDGGETWTRSWSGNAASYLIAATEQSVWIADLNGGPLWRAPVGSDDFTRVDVGGHAPLSDLQVLDGAVVLTRTPEGGRETPSLVSRDDGQTWTELTQPEGCGYQFPLPGSGLGAFLSCDAGDGSVTVYRSTDLATWTAWGTANVGSMLGLVLDDEHVLFRDDHEVVVSGDGTVGAHTGLSWGQGAGDVAVLDDTFYMTTDAGVLSSEDQGRTWQPVD